MPEDSAAKALRALAKGEQNRSQIARLRDLIDEVEAALASGVSRAAVLHTLHEHGFTFTPSSFESALYRIRKQARKPPLLPSRTPNRKRTWGGLRSGRQTLHHDPNPDEDLLK